MCDYSLAAVASRPAKVGDKLVTSNFPSTVTRGFAEVGAPNVAVCVLPGTEIGFDRDVAYYDPGACTMRTASASATFRQINVDKSHTHHDALEFAGGVVLLTDLVEGQYATVLQLPVEPQKRIENREGPTIIFAQEPEDETV